MATEAKKNKILVFGATGYLGKYLVKASLAMGHPTYAYVRMSIAEAAAAADSPNSPRHLLLHQYQSMGVTIFKGGLDEHEKLVSAIQQVDIVISALAIPQHNEQYKIIDAIKEAGNIKRFVPSEFGNETDRGQALPPFQKVIDDRKKIRRAIEASGIPYTFISSNSFGAYFIDILFHPREKMEEVTVYGAGEAKVVVNYEEDIAAYTILAVNDPRTLNEVVNYQPPENIVNQRELISLWEKKTGAILRKTQLSVEQVVRLAESKYYLYTERIFTTNMFVLMISAFAFVPIAALPPPDNVHMAVVHSLFIQGDQTSFELGEEFLEASKLYPDYKYTSVDRLLDICINNPPETKLTRI
ncbi:hypothetical protein ACLOJK_033248 [Asimina triloba]